MVHYWAYLIAHHSYAIMPLLFHLIRYVWNIYISIYIYISCSCNVGKSTCPGSLKLTTMTTMTWIIIVKCIIHQHDNYNLIVGCSISHCILATSKQRVRSSSPQPSADRGLQTAGTGSLFIISSSSKTTHLHGSWLHLRFPWDPTWPDPTRCQGHCTASSVGEAHWGRKRGLDAVSSIA